MLVLVLVVLLAWFFVEGEDEHDEEDDFQRIMVKSPSLVWLEDFQK